VAGRLATYRDNPELLTAPPPREKPGDPEPASAPARRPGGNADLPQWFRELDTDGDGQVGLYEWRLGAGRLASEFSLLDPDGDGLLTPDELRRFLQMHPESPYAAATLPPPAGGGQPWHPARRSPGVANRPPK
jgi:hypothetical protein